MLTFYISNSINPKQNQIALNKIKNKAKCCKKHNNQAQRFKPGQHHYIENKMGQRSCAALVCENERFTE